MRVLFTTQPAYGHFHPLVPLAYAVRDAGHEVRVACAPSFAPAVRSAGLSPLPAGMDWTESDGGLGEAFPELYRIPGTTEGNRWVVENVYGGATAEAMARDLLERMDEVEPDVIVRGSFEFGGMLAAEAARVPHASVQVGAHATFERNREPLRLGLARTTRDLGLDLPDPVARVHRHLLISFVPPRFQDPAFPLPATGRAFRAPLAGGVGAAPAWLAGMPHPRTVYMTMGTVFTTRADPYLRVLEALGDLEVNLVLTVGHARDPAEFGPRPPHVRIERYVPQAALLPHCGAVICHGGFNTVLASLAHGLPLVVMPVSADQPENAARAEALGAARVVPYGDSGADDVRDAVLRVLTDGRYRDAARRVREEIRELPTVDGAVAQLVRLASEGSARA